MPLALVSRDKRAHRFRWNAGIAGPIAQIVVVFVEVVAASIGPIVDPIVGGPAIASIAIKSEQAAERQYSLNKS